MSLWPLLVDRYVSYTDELLFSLLKRGDNGVFIALYDRYARGIFKYIQARVHDDELTKDLVQNVFFALWQQRETLVIRSSLNDYIYRTAKNSVLMHMRSEAIQKKYTAQFTHLANLYDNNTEEAMSLNDLNATLEKSIAELPERCQTAFRLSRYENMPLPQIAERMNISVHTVENYITTALKHLRGSLGEFMFLAVLLGIWREW